MTTQIGGLICHICSIKSTKIAAILSGTIVAAVTIASMVHNVAAVTIGSIVHNVVAVTIASIVHIVADVTIVITIRIAQLTAKDPKEIPATPAPEDALAQRVTEVLQARLEQREQRERLV